MSSKRKAIHLSLLACLQLLGIALFCKGFFPYKVYLSGFADEVVHDAPQFDRLVFVLIDALRNDFILGEHSGFHFVNQQIKLGRAYPFTAKATAPTVTLPRIKALTTGTIPSFLDAILNIAETDTSASLTHHDNWLYQFRKQHNRTLHFFGDDTWLRLFPNDIFTKTDGTTSFFVSDTVQVDWNVTRHIETDITVQDWDAVILHYLGLDHIGHLSGPQSPLMKPKQLEMDKAIQSIYAIVKAQDQKRIRPEDPPSKGTLLIVCGDHGMNEKGNHGGSTLGETSAALVFLSPSFEDQPAKALIDVKRPMAFGYPVMDQIDLVPTLATLFAFPIPKNSIGKLILDLYKEDIPSILRHLERNAQQLGRLLAKSVPAFAKTFDQPAHGVDALTDSFGQLYVKAKQLHHQYIQTNEEKRGKHAAAAYYEFIEAAQAQLANTACDYSLSQMLIGVVCICLTAVGFIRLAMLRPKTLSLSAEDTHSVTDNKHHWGGMTQRFAIIGLMLYAVSMFASSFVEEEHATWYFFTQTSTMLAIYHSARLSPSSVPYIAVELFLVRLTIAWNSLSFSDATTFHLLAFSLLASVVYSARSLQRLHHDNRWVDVHQTSKIIQCIVKLILFLILLFQSVFVFAYKIRSHPAITNLPSIYNALLDWELLQQLTQIQLGRLIYNYCGAGLLGLYGLFYVLQRSKKMDFTEQEDNEGERRVENKEVVERMEDNKNENISAWRKKADQVTSVSGLILQLLLYMLTPVFILLSDNHNAFLFFLFTLQFQCLLTWHAKLKVPVWFTSVLVTCLCHTAFFATGHSNSIASVDLSNAYIGVEQYDTLFIGILTFCSNWSASLWWSIAGWALCVSTTSSTAMTLNHPTDVKRLEPTKSGGWMDYILVQCILFSVALAFLSIAVTILREHLFIWTVFSPKYLYQIAWTCLFHWVHQVMIGSLCTQMMFKQKIG
ncbi:alkaline-phosphatase-like protein [Mycotypha africana]|uniref:alkaline-phosphatase-like protein n=1 Tax=Mycotypha africana TaxID=64632 RepID=UPI0022FFE911|nr:alkaline-phosphatase-like protein [Mycotypha africana]KAI8967243.1 alkaline-phosphatase-like protein [Mycotypha africana]